MLNKLKLTALTALSAAYLVAPTFAQAAETYHLDPTHTAITWQVNHFGFSSPTGKFMSAEGTVTLDEKKPENSKVDVTIDVTKINSGVEKLDEHLAKEDFFNTAKFKTATFKSDKVELTGKDTAKVTGQFTLLGVTKPVTLDVKLNKLAENMFKKQTAGFTATTTIKRSDFGMSIYTPDLSDNVLITIEAEANLVSGVAEKAPAKK